jgi:hypothetical protein
MYSCATRPPPISGVRMPRAVRGGPRTRSAVSARAKRREPSLAAYSVSSRATRRRVPRRAFPERMQAASSCPSCIFRLTPTSSSPCHTQAVRLHRASQLLSPVAPVLVHTIAAIAKHLVQRRSIVVWGHHCRPTPTLKPIEPVPRLHRRPPRRRRWSSGCRSAVPLYYLAGTFSSLSNPRNGTLGKPRPLLGPFPTKLGLPLVRFRRFPSLATARHYIARSEVFLGAVT